MREPISDAPAQGPPETRGDHDVIFIDADRVHTLIDYPGLVDALDRHHLEDIDDTAT